MGSCGAPYAALTDSTEVFTLMPLTLHFRSRQTFSTSGSLENSFSVASKGALLADSAVALV